MPPDSYMTRSCPNCGSTNREEQYASKISAESMDIESLSGHWSGFFKDKVFFSYSKCRSCSLTYAPVYFTEQQLSQLYADMRPNMDSVSTQAIQRTQEAYFNIAKRHMRDTSRGYLELGPDVGYFVDLAVKNNQHDHFWLFEPNEAVTGALAGKLEARSFNVKRDMFELSDVPDKSVSVAVLIHVLDHLTSPLQTLADVRNKLTPDGIIVVVTHNEASVLRKVTGAKWPAFCLQHPQLFSPLTIASLLETAGYRLQEITRTVNFFEIGFLTQHLLWLLGIKIRGTFPGSDQQVGLRLGNIITIGRNT